MTIPIKIISKKEYLKKNKEPNQEEVWDSIAVPWKEYRSNQIPIVAEFLNKAGSDFKKSEKCKIVDLGCGSGRNMIKNDNIEYYGVDFSGEQLKQAEEYLKNEKINAKLFKADIGTEGLDKNIFQDEMFDYGLFIATLHCIEGKKERENALKEFYRVLKKGSEALITIWNSEDERFDGKTGDFYMSWKKDGKEHMRYYYLYDKKELVELLEKIGFKIIEEFQEREKDRFSRKNWIFKIKKRLN